MGRYSVSRVKIDFTGSKINGWEVLEKAPNGLRGRVLWKCKCLECGVIKDVRDDCLKLNRFGCIDCTNQKPLGTRIQGQESVLYKGTKDISLTQWNHIRKGAVRKSRTLDFLISIEYAQKLLEEQNYTCKLSGSALITQDPNKKYSGKAITASLDRIDSSKGYIEGNVQWVQRKVNILKWNLDQSEFISWCGLVWNHHLTSISTSCASTESTTKF